MDFIIVMKIRACLVENARKKKIINTVLNVAMIQPTKKLNAKNVLMIKNTFLMMVFVKLEVVAM